MTYTTGSPAVGIRTGAAARAARTAAAGTVTIPAFTVLFFTVLFSTVLVLAATPAPAHAQVTAPLPRSGAVTVTVTGQESLGSDVEFIKFEAELPGGTVARGVITRWPHSSDVTLLAAIPDPDRLQLAPMRRIVERSPGYAPLAAVNGGYHLSRIPGVSNGPSLIDGTFQSSSTLHGDLSELVGGRGVVASIAGKLVYDRAGLEIFLQDEQGELVVPAEINRPASPYGGSLYTPAGQHLAYVPDGGQVLELDLAAVPAGGSVWVTVTDHGRAIPPKTETLLLILGPELSGSGVRTGDRLYLTSELRSQSGTLNQTRPDWIVPGGPLLLSRGEMSAAAYQPGLDRDQGEALSESHRLGRHPRTAVASGATASMLITIDGRLSGWSAGVTLEELAGILQAFGMTDAVNLDGGGPSEMLTRSEDGRLVSVNRPTAPERGSVSALILSKPDAWPGYDVRWGTNQDQRLRCRFTGQYEPVAVRDGVWHTPTITFDASPPAPEAVALCGAFRGGLGKHEAAWWTSGTLTLIETSSGTRSATFTLPPFTRTPSTTGLVDGHDLLRFSSPLAHIDLASDGGGRITIRRPQDWITQARELP